MFDPNHKRNPRWRPGDLLRQRNGWQHELTAAERNAIRQAAEILPEGSYAHMPKLALDDGLGRLFAAIQSALEEGFGFFLLRGVPMAGLSNGDAKRLYFALSLNLGTPVFQDAVASRIVEIKATDAPLEAAFNYKAKGASGHFRPYETRVAFSFHSDPADVAGLLCLAQASVGGATRLVSACAIHAEIAAKHEKLLAALYQPYYYAKPERSGEPLGYHSIPVFSSWQGLFKTHVVPDLVWLAQRRPGIPSLTQDQIEALHLLEEIAGRPEFHFEFTLQPGDLLLTNNHVVYHARSAYEDTFGQPRCLLRLWLAVPNSRELDPKHREWFGDPGAGKLRGGFLRERLAELEPPLHTG